MLHSSRLQGRKRSWSDHVCGCREASYRILALLIGPSFLHRGQACTDDGPGMHRCVGDRCLAGVGDGMGLPPWPRLEPFVTFVPWAPCSLGPTKLGDDEKPGRHAGQGTWRYSAPAMAEPDSWTAGGLSAFSAFSASSAFPDFSAFSGFSAFSAFVSWYFGVGILDYVSCITLPSTLYLRWMLYWYLLSLALQFSYLIYLTFLAFMPNHFLSGFAFQ